MCRLEYLLIVVGEGKKALYEVGALLLRRPRQNQAHLGQNQFSTCSKTWQFLRNV
jgi:hypothetical protein